MLKLILYFVTPVFKDAKPIIDYFGLKKDMAFTPFPVFIGEDVVLCISGENTANTAAAVSYVLTRFGKNGLLVHISSCDTYSGIVYPAVIEYNELRVYQEMLYKPPFDISKEATIITDGMGVYAFMAAACFLPLKQIIVIRSPKYIDERILLWLETLCYGMMSFPTYMWKREQASII